MTKLEEIARAIANTIHGGGDYGMTGDDAYEKRPDEFLALALAAVRALREPDKAMVIAGDDEKDDCIDSGWSSDADGNRYDYTIINSDIAARVYRAMIDAILSEVKQEDA